MAAGWKCSKILYNLLFLYLLENVKDWFQEDIDISNTEIVIAVQKGNPEQIKNLGDLTKPGIRVTVGQPQQCTIGALTRIMLEKEGMKKAVMKNVVTQTASSAMLVPTVTTMTHYRSGPENTARSEVDIVRCLKQTDTELLS